MARGPIKRKINKGKMGQLRLKGISGIPVLVTERDVKIAEGIAAGKTKKQALIDAGISEKNARSNSAELTSEPGVIAALEIALDKADATLDRVAGVIDRGLDAKKIVVIGKDVYQMEDHGIQHQFVRTVAELRDWFPDKKTKVDHSGAICITDEADKELVHWLKSALQK